MEKRREAVEQWERAIEDQRDRKKKLGRQEVAAESRGRKRKKGRTGPGRDKMLGERFNAATRKRRQRRATAKAGRHAARKGRR